MNKNIRVIEYLMTRINREREKEESKVYASSLR